MGKLTENINKIKPNPKNPRIIKNDKFQKLVKSIKDFPKMLELRPIVIDENNVVLGGNMRLKACKEVGLKEVPVIYASDLTDNQKKEFIIKDNVGFGEWDFDSLANEFELEDLDKWGMDGIDKYLESALDDDDLTVDNDNQEDAIGNISSVFSLKDYAVFSSDNELGIPELKKDMCADIPSEIKVWNGIRSEESEYYLHIHQNKSTKGLNPKKSILAFYTHDHKFEQTWKSPAEWTEKFLRQGWKSIVGANFSLWGFEPKILHLIQTFKTRWLARYWQEAGISVVPDIDWVNDKSFEFCLYGIPKNIPAISIQVQTSLQEDEKKQRMSGIEIMLNEIKPKKILIYGAKKDKEEINELVISKNVQPIFVKELVGFAKHK